MKQFAYHTAVIPAYDFDSRDIFDNPEMIDKLYHDREKIITDIITRPDFVGLELPHYYGVYYLHKSKYAGYKWQFSRLANDGFFNGHKDIAQLSDLFTTAAGKMHECMHEMIAAARGDRDATITYITA